MPEPIQNHLQVLAARKYPYEFAGADDSGERLFVGVISDGTVVPIAFDADTMERSFSRKIQSMDRHDTDLVSCAMNIAHKYALASVEQQWANTTLTERLRWLFRRRKENTDA